MATGASRPWNLSTVPTLTPSGQPARASASSIALICALYGVTIRIWSAPTGAAVVALTAKRPRDHATGRADVEMVIAGASRVG
jgi:hypothetical protein